MGKIEVLVAYTYLFAVWFANINDLIRGEWFFHNTLSILWWNGIGVLCLFSVIYKSKQEIRG